MSKISTVTGITICLILACSVLAARFENPICQETPRTTNLPTKDTLLIFMVAYGLRDIDEVFYSLKQTTCWLPNSDKIKAAVFYQNDGKDTFPSQIKEFAKFNDIRDTLKSNAQLASQHPIGRIRKCAAYEKDLKVLKSLEATTLKNFQQIVLITHQSHRGPLGAVQHDTCHYYDIFKAAGLDSKFKFSFIRFDNVIEHDHPTLSVPNFYGVNKISSEAPESLRSSTKEFMDEILGVKSKKDSEGISMTVIIIIIVVVLVIVGAIAGIVIWCVCKKRKNNKNGGTDKKKRKKSGKGKDVEKNSKSSETTSKHSGK